MLSSSFRQLIRFHTTYTEHNTGISYPFIRSYTLTAPRLASPPKQLLDLPSLSDETHHALARTWLDGFTLDDIPKNSYEVTYSRSSGPGGQHVNTTSSKATVRCDLSSAYGVWLPHFLASPLSRSPNHLASPPSLLFTSQTTRSASTNLQQSLNSLHRAIITAGRSVVIGETSEVQKEKVEVLKGFAKVKRRVGKDKRGSKKAGRRGDWD